MISMKTHGEPAETGKHNNGMRSWMTVVGWAVGAVLLGAILLIGAGCGDIEIDLSSESDEPVETRDDSFTVGSSPRLEVDSFNGRITVSLSSDDTIRVQATLRRADRIEYQVSQDGDTVRAEAREKGKTLGRSPGADIKVTAPVSTRVELRSSNGAIEVAGIEESGHLDTSNGKIVLKSVRGDFDASTSNGGIDVSGLVGTVTLETSNGSIDFTGELTPDGRNEMRTSNGSVHVHLQGTPSVRLDATTSNGGVTSKLPILATSTGENHLTGTIGDGDADLVIRTSNGSVTVQ